jgi:outer membrane receptor protein involved in Fe transport
LAWLAVAGTTVAQPVSTPAAPHEQIIVTGERVKRSLSETASSVVVIGRRDIEAAGADRAEQMLTLVPNVQLGSGSQGPAIRGLDTTGPLQALPAFLGGNRPRTTIIVDGRPVTYSEFVFGPAPLWDVERVEVYRSPQTTTQGVNSIAGAIFIFSEDPTFEPEARLRLIAGDYRTRQVSVAASTGLSREIALRVAGDLRYSRATSRIAPIMSGADPNHDVSGLLRAKFLLAPLRSPETRLLVTLTHSVSQSPQVVGLSAPFRARRDLAPNYGVFRVRVNSITAALRQELGKGVSANFLLTGGSSSARRFALAGFGETTSDGTDWSAEAVVNWEGPGVVRGVAGMSYNHVRLKQRINLSLLSGLIGSFRDWQDGAGLFVEASAKVARRTTLTAGLRYQHDRQKRTGALVTNSFSVPADFVGTFHELLPKISLAYDLTSEWRAGVLVQKAYNPGGTTIRFETAKPDSFEAETLWDTELFARGRLADGRLLLSANLFNYAMRNAQRADPITIFTPTGRRVGFANLFNVPRARSRGLEATADWRATSKLTVRGSIGLLSTRITRTDAESAAYQEKQFDRSPHFTGTIAVDLRPVPKLRLSAQVRRHSSYFSDNADNPVLRIGPSTIADARLEYQLRPFLLFFQARNLFDSFAMAYMTTASSGEAEGPRRISAGLEMRF